MSLIDCIGVMQNSFEREMPIFAIPTGQQQQQQQQQAPVNYLQQSPMPLHAQQPGFQYNGYAPSPQQSPFTSPTPQMQQQPVMNQQHYAHGQPQYQSGYQQ
jgi:hypothetical protein